MNHTKYDVAAQGWVNEPKQEKDLVLILIASLLFVITCSITITGFANWIVGI